MHHPLLSTKFHVPQRRSGLVSRPALTGRLARGAETKLTLVSAPPGFGKTTLLAESIAASPERGQSVAWLSLDNGDNEPVSFWTYLITALQTVAPEVGVSALAHLHAPQPRPIEEIVSLLVNDLVELPGEIILVLDDYHLVDTPLVQGGMAFLLEHLPARMHVVMATRADPALPLARLRGRGELVEIRAAELRFSPEEIAAYLNGVMRLELETSDIAALAARTEGWIAALQLAALSIQDRDDATRFIASFAGDDRYVVDYLVDEVLERQSDDARRFLLQTSVLDRLSGSLCDAVTAGRGGEVMLRALDRGNLFVVPLDDRRQWYRYHHLFADVLRARLLDEQPDLVPDLHRRASAWYERHGEPLEAIEHAVAGGDLVRAADLIEVALPALRQARQEVAMRRWLEALPDETFASRPVLSVHRAGVLLASGELDDAKARLSDAERWLEMADGGVRPRGTSPMVVRDEDGMRRLPAQIAIYRAALAQAAGDADGTTAQARRALELVGEDDHFERGAAAGFLGLVHWREGDLETAHRFWRDAMRNLRMAGHLVDAIGCLRPIAQIRLAQGRLGDAMRAYQRGLQLASEQGPAVLRGAADMHVGMAEVLIEWNDLEGAADHLMASQKLGDHAGLAQYPYRWRIVSARSREAHGDADGALDLLRDAERRYVSEYYPDVRPVGARMARIWALQGRVADALDWAHERGLKADDELSYLREFEHLTLARVLLARAKQDAAATSTSAPAQLLRRLLTAAEQGQRAGSAVELLILQALAHQQIGDVPAALASLDRALTLAEPERSIRVFLDEGSSMASLLKVASQRGVAPDFVARLLDAFRSTAGPAVATAGLVEPLSERELDVLRLLATELDGPAIAAELVIGLSTVRSHTKSIYGKLGVHSRRAAIGRAHELGLLRGARFN
ncbi:MAG TPA: LuxR C-terminal-related transcriptional regulator [Candidatus Angelobacter sp.]|nr:LuxR C-terminal-related transcriptional regulator [Candidatus Angelobacter sp.]